jgi:hypothetical protein
MPCVRDPASVPEPLISEDIDLSLVPLSCPLRPGKPRFVSQGGGRANGKGKTLINSKAPGRCAITIISAEALALAVQRCASQLGRPTSPPLACGCLGEICLGKGRESLITYC